MEKQNKTENLLQDENNERNDLDPGVDLAIEEIIKKEGYLNYEMYKKKITSEGRNFLGVLYEVNIKGTTAVGIHETNLFVKQAIPKCDNMKLLSISEIYSKEKFTYRELSKIFNKLQEKAQVPIEERFKMVRSYDESTIEAIILDNMAQKRFKTYKNVDIMELKFAELSIQQLAKFHGLSFVVEKRMPKFFEKKIKSLKNSLHYDDDYREFLEKMYALSTNKLTPSIKSKIDRRWDTLIENYFNYSQGTTDVKCLCHGDFKMNNILFKEIDGDVTEVAVLDYQLIYYGSPIIDFLFFTFMGTDRKFRKNHLNHLKDVYHNSLKDFLEYFDMPVDEVYPRNMFESDYKNCLDFSLVNSLVLMPFNFTAEDEKPDFGKEDLRDMDFRVDDIFYDRIHGVFDDFIEWGYI